MANDHTPADLGAHQHTYSGFIALFKWGTVAAVAVTAIVVLLIAS
ncbi:aa3-type cytochrome c oxidase subunit IV [Sphingomonas sp. ID0503]